MRPPVLETDAMPSTNFQTVQARRARLAKWIDERHGGVQSEFLASTGLNQGMVSALVAGSKPFGEKLAANIEQKAGMPPGHLVNPLGDQPAMPSTRSNVPLDLAVARLENDSDVLNQVFGAMFTVMLKHRPAEAEEFLKRLDLIPGEFQDQGLVQVLRKVARARKAKA